MGHQADVFEAKGDIERAVDYYVKALTVMLRVDPKGTLSLMNFEINIKEMAKHILSSNHSTYGHILAMLAKASEKNNQMNESKAALEESARILKPQN